MYKIINHIIASYYISLYLPHCKKGQFKKEILLFLVNHQLGKKHDHFRIEK